MPLWAFYSLVGFVVLPYLIQTNFSKQVRKNLNSDAYLEKVYLNPFTFELGLKNLLVNDAKHNTLLYFKKLDLDLGFTNLLSGDIYLQRLVIEGLRANIDIYKDGKFNFSYILEQLGDNKKAPAAEERKGPGTVFSMGRFLLKDTVVQFSDDTKF